MVAADDAWVATSCGQCYCQCGVLAHRKNGIVVRIEGNPKAPAGSGRICPKGAAGPMLMYDPYRLNYPLKRTNPEKGVGVDPKWQRITWDEALETITAKLKATLEKDPRACYFQATTTHSSEIRFGVIAFMRAFGFQNYWVSGGGLHCGNGAHFMNGIMHAAWSIIPDFAHANYVLYFGCSKGHGAGHVAVQNAQQVSDARARGMKAVVFDPFLSAQASKAHEWVPIRVGTDGALALGMANILVNELGIYDARYLKEKTNAAYLIGPDELYARDQASGKPTVWDPVDKKAKTFDDPSVRDYALEGTYDVGGVQATPAFALLKEHLKTYPAEKVSKITTIPAATIRRIAKEFGREAQIGSTIVLEGKEFPFRPVAAIFFRGAQGHVNSGWTCLSIDLLNHLVGAADTAGGALGLGPAVYHGSPWTGKPRSVPFPDKDGLMVADGWVYDHKAYPLREPKQSTRLDLQDMFPTSVYNAFTIMSPKNEELWKQFQIPYRPEIMINYGSNSVMTMGNAQVVTENFLKKFKFVFSFNIFMTEFEEAVADIVLPDGCYLERTTPAITWPATFAHPQGPGNWGWQIRQQVVPLQFERRDFNEVMLDLAKRLGLQGKFFEALNKLIPVRYGGPMTDEYKFKADGNYSWLEICDRLIKDRFGADKGLEYAKKDGVITWPKKAEEIYWKWFVPVRVPVYFEFFKEGGRKGRELAAKFGMPDIIDWSRFKPLPDWYPCPTHTEKNPEFDLYTFYWRPVMHCNSLTMENPWLDEIAVNDPYVYRAQLNTDTARKKGLQDGDEVWIENPQGHRVKGRLAVTEGIHPEHLAIAACAGHWTAAQPIARGKGIFFNDLVEMDVEHTDPLTLGQDICIKVKIYKANGQ